MREREEEALNAGMGEFHGDIVVVNKKKKWEYFYQFWLGGKV